MRSSAVLVLALALTCAKATTTTTTPGGASEPGGGPSIILPDRATVRLEVASDDATREQGLMFRDRIAEGTGMLFLFPTTGKYAFWMKNTIVPLDMIWIDEARRVVHVEHDVPPCRADPCPSYPPSAPARYVLELAAGQAAKHRVTNGTTLEFVGLDRVVVR